MCSSNISASRWVVACWTNWSFSETFSRADAMIAEKCAFFASLTDTIVGPIHGSSTCIVRFLLYLSPAPPLQLSTAFHCQVLLNKWRCSMASTDGKKRTESNHIYVQALFLIPCGSKGLENSMSYHHPENAPEYILAPGQACLLSLPPAPTLHDTHPTMQR